MKIVLAVLLASVGACAWADDLYFGGHGDTNTHWTGYSVQLSTDGLTNWVAYTLARPGQIARAPATFQRTDTNRWSVVFDEYVFGTNGAFIGLAGHALVVLRIGPKGIITIQDGADELKLKKTTAEELKRIERGRPNNTPEDIRR